MTIKNIHCYCCKYETLPHLVLAIIPIEETGIGDIGCAAWPRFMKVMLICVLSSAESIAHTRLGRSRALSLAFYILLWGLLGYTLIIPNIW